MFVYTCDVFFCGCCCSVCSCTAVVAAAVRHRVPDGKFVAVVHCICYQCFLSLYSNTIYFNARTTWHYCRIYSLDFPIIRYHTSSVNTDMREAKVGVIPPRRSPLCIYYVSPSCCGNTTIHLLSAFRRQAQIKAGFTTPIQ